MDIIVAILVATVRATVFLDLVIADVTRGCRIFENVHDILLKHLGTVLLCALIQFQWMAIFA